MILQQNKGNLSTISSMDNISNNSNIGNNSNIIFPCKTNNKNNGKKKLHRRY